MKYSSGFKRYFVNTSWLIFEKAFRLFTTFIVAIYVARYLGPERLGLLSYAQSYVALFMTIATLGLDEIVVRELVRDERKRDSLLGTSFILKVFGMLIMWLIIASTVQFTNNDAFTNLLIGIIAGGSIFQVFYTVDFYFRAKVLSKYSVYARTTSGIVTPILKIGLIFTQADLLWFTLVLLVEGLLTAIIFIFVYRYKKLFILQWRYNWQIAKLLLRDSWPLIFAGLMISLYMRIDQVMLKNMMNVTEVGIYSVAVRLSEFWYFIPMLITQSLFPAIIKAKELGKEHYDRRMGQLYDFMTFISLSIAIVMTFSSSFIIDTLFGYEYADSAKVLAIHIWAGVFVFYGTSRGRWIIVENLQKKAIVVHVIGALLNIILNILLIPMYGSMGAAVATLLSYSITTVITGYCIKEFRLQLLLFLKSFIHCLTLKPIRNLNLNR